MYNKFLFTKINCSYLTLLVFLLSCNSLISQSNSLKIYKSAITSIGANSVQTKQNLISQSVGQTGVIGTVTLKNNSIQQGFLTNVISFNIINKNNVIRETLNFTISPNPFVDRIEINFSETTKKDIFIRIYDVNGKVFKFKNYKPTNKILIPLAGFSIGTYLIQVKSGVHISTKKIIKTQ